MEPILDKEDELGYPPETELELLLERIDEEASARAGSRPPMSMIVPVRAYAVLDGFLFNRTEVPAQHAPTIDRLAPLVLTSWRGPRPIRTIRLVGHTDNTGAVPYNFALGRRRAEAAQRILTSALERLRPGLSQKVQIIIRGSAGSTWPVVSNTTAAGRARNRRVEIFLVGGPSSHPFAGSTGKYHFTEPEFQDAPSPVRVAFEEALRASNWEEAFRNLNGLNMFEMLRALAAADPARLDQLWLRRTAYENSVNLPRIHHARNVVLNKVLPPIPCGDLRQTGQVGDAADFLAEQFAPIARPVNPDPLANISLILQECNFYDIQDKSHIAYVLASAHHESAMGRLMTELASGDAYEGRADLCNTVAGDGRRFKGRGFVQITGRCNYTFYNDFLLTRGLTVDLLNNPGQATDPAIAAMIIAHGMKYGRFTARRLSQFGTDCNYNFVRARAIVGAAVVNRRNVARPIAAVARRYRAAMN